MTGNAVREKRGDETKDEEKMTVAMAKLTPDDGDNKATTVHKIHMTYLHYICT